MKNRARALLDSLRPSQWTKNLLVFAALVFGHRATDPGAIYSALLAFAVFCAAASAIYLLNDITDRQADRRHPLKRERPIAAGALSVPVAAATCLILMVTALGLSLRLGDDFTAILATFLGLQIMYSFGLKRVVIIDVFIVAFGFVIRAAAGALAIEVAISPWLLVCSLTLALFLALAKRRHEIEFLKDTASEHRAALSHYSPYFLDQMIAVVTAVTVMAYALYTLSADTIAKFNTEYLVITLPFVIYGVFRYLYLVHQEHAGANPTRLFLTDPAILINTALWLGVSAWIVYG